MGVGPLLCLQMLVRDTGSSLDTAREGYFLPSVLKEPFTKALSVPRMAMEHWDIVIHVKEPTCWHLHSYPSLLSRPSTDTTMGSHPLWQLNFGAEIWQRSLSFKPPSPSCDSVLVRLPRGSAVTNKGRSAHFKIIHCCQHKENSESWKLHSNDAEAQLLTRKGQTKWALVRMVFINYSATQEKN